MLENEDIQHILLARTPALTGRYEFLSFRNAACGRAWLSAIWEKAQSVAEVMASVEKDKRWVTLAFTWNVLRAQTSMPLLSCLPATPPSAVAVRSNTPISWHGAKAWRYYLLWSWWGGP